MVRRAPPQPWLPCPSCGRLMPIVEIPIATPPFVVELSGCERCGITSNEFAAPAGARHGRLFRDRNAR